LTEKRSLLALSEQAGLSRTDAPIPHARPVVAVVDRLSPRWAAEHLAAVISARGARVARLMASLRAREGGEQVGDHVRASADAMRGALTRALAGLPSHDLLVIEGPAAVALLDARLAILTSPGSVLTLPPDVRALRSCFDLVLFAERASVLDQIAAMLRP
jgi:hypothetical protein